MTENMLDNEQNELLSNDIGATELEATGPIYSQTPFSWQWLTYTRMPSISVSEQHTPESGLHRHSNILSPTSSSINSIRTSILDFSSRSSQAFRRVPVGSKSYVSDTKQIISSDNPDHQSSSNFLSKHAFPTSSILSIDSAAKSVIISERYIESTPHVDGEQENSSI